VFNTRYLALGDAESALSRCATARGTGRPAMLKTKSTRLVERTADSTPHVRRRDSRPESRFAPNKLPPPPGWRRPVSVPPSYPETPFLPDSPPTLLAPIRPYIGNYAPTREWTLTRSPAPSLPPSPTPPYSHRVTFAAESESDRAPNASDVARCRDLPSLGVCPHLVGSRPSGNELKGRPK
jgi:hypothetical protein